MELLVTISIFQSSSGAIHTSLHQQPGSLKGRCCRGEGRASGASGPRHDEGNQHRRGQETSAFGGRPWRRLVDEQTPEKLVVEKC